MKAMRLRQHAQKALERRYQYEEIVERPTNELGLAELEMKRGYLIGKMEETWRVLAIVSGEDRELFRGEILRLAELLGELEIRKEVLKILR
jgi:hypothetical protein